MIKTVKFRNFKALRDVKLDLAPLNLIVGPNASGKTSLLEGLHYVTQAGARPPEALFMFERHPTRVRSVGAEGPMELSVELDRADGTATVAIAVEPLADGRWRFTTRLNHSGGHSEASFDGKQRPDLPSRIGGPFLQELRSAVLLRLDPDKLAKPGFSEEPIPRVEYDGANLAAVLADLRITNPKRCEEIVAKLRSVVPSVSDIRFERTPIERIAYEPGPEEFRGLYEQVRTRDMGYSFYLDFASGVDISAHQASEGTLLTLGLLAVLSGKVRPSLVLVDELERALHPKALGELVRQIRALQKEFPDLQVIATTHSPYLVDHFDASEVILTTLRDDGSVVAGRLHEHPEFERWKDEMKPGEFWSTVGEDWLKDKKGEEGE
ncbi:MAG TPA: AAA family ATPase [Phycisphaerae bacterium]|nr:AAA family ATPase [Phycisphaerae bacterium]